MEIFVYRMGRLCGGAHEISGIKAHFFSMVVGWKVLGEGGRVGGSAVGCGMVGWWQGGSWDGWVSGWVVVGMAGGWVVVRWVGFGVVGLWVPMTPGASDAPHVIF